MLSKPALRLLLVRHGVTSWNGDGRCLGRTDLSLSNEGKRSVQALADVIDLSHVAAAYISPACRAVETASILLKHSRVSPVIREELQEIMWPPVWEGKTWSEIATHDPHNYAAFTANPIHFSLDCGESLFEVQTRIVRFYKEMQQRHTGEALLFIGHGCVLNTLLCYLLGVKLNIIFPFDLRPASLSEIVVFSEGNSTLTTLSFVPQFQPSMDLSRAEGLR